MARRNRLQLSPELVEKLQSQHAAGLKADLMLRAYGDLHDERERRTVNELITWFRSEKWDERTAIRLIAALNENRAQKEELEHRSRKGSQARQRLFGGPTAEPDSAAERN